MKALVVCFLLAIGTLVGCGPTEVTKRAYYKPVLVIQRAENVYFFAPAHESSHHRYGVAASVVWEEFSEWAAKNAEKYEVTAVVPAYGSCLVVTVKEKRTPPNVP